MEISSAQIVIAIIGLLGVIITTTVAAFGIPAYTGLRRDMREQKAEYEREKKDCAAELGKLKLEIVALQAKTRKDVLPQWHKNNDGKILWVNAIYVQRFLAPFNLDAAAVLGKSDNEIECFSDQLKEALLSLDRKARDDGYASASGIQFNRDSVRKWTIIKELSVDPLMGVITFSGIACEER